jgi:hypothetical protein
MLREEKEELFQELKKKACMKTFQTAVYPSSRLEGEGKILLKTSPFW